MRNVLKEEDISRFIENIMRSMEHAPINADNTKENETSHDNVVVYADVTSTPTVTNKLITENELKNLLTRLSNVYVTKEESGNANTVNNLTVETAVPPNAKFTDTVYDDSNVLEKSDTKTEITPVNKLITENELSALLTRLSNVYVTKEEYGNGDTVNDDTDVLKKSDTKTEVTDTNKLITENELKNLVTNGGGSNDNENSNVTLHDVNNKTEMLALSANNGDYCRYLDGIETFIHVYVNSEWLFIDKDIVVDNLINDFGMEIVVTPTASSISIKSTGTLSIDFGDGVIVDHEMGSVATTLTADVVGSYRVKILGTNVTEFSITSSSVILTATLIKASELINADNFLNNQSALKTFTYISGFEKCTSMNSAWRNCRSLTGFPLIDTSKCTSMNSAWYGCSSLPGFPLIDTSKCTSLDYTWYSCSSFTMFPLIDTSKCTSLDYTWRYCRSLPGFPLIDTSKCITLTSTWQGCSSFTMFPLIDTSKCTELLSTWSNCRSFTMFPLIDTSKCITFTSTWYRCDGLIEFPPIDTHSATAMSSTWYYCSGLTSMPALDTLNCTTFYAVFRDCGSLTIIYGINTINKRNTSYMFYNCKALVHPNADEQTAIMNGLNYIYTETPNEG